MEVYILLMALLLGQTGTNVPSDVTVSDVLDVHIGYSTDCIIAFTAYGLV